MVNKEKNLELNGDSKNKSKKRIKTDFDYSSNCCPKNINNKNKRKK